VRQPELSERANHAAPRLTVGITTRNRHASLARCLASLRHIEHLAPEILVFDDASEEPVAKMLTAFDLKAGATPSAVEATASAPKATASPAKVRIVRDDRGPGNIVGRNVLMREATAPAVLLLDDDAALLDGASIERALDLLSKDENVAAVAFAQANDDGAPWPESMQPGRGQSIRYVAAFIGFAHLLRRDVFLRLGGYRESFVFYGEEKDYCLRLLEHGLSVVYLPDALVVHAQDASGRTPQRYLRYVTRNDCLTAIYNEPLARVVWLLPSHPEIQREARRLRDSPAPYSAVVGRRP
jgi:GT2 family glycosyltransferase